MAVMVKEAQDLLLFLAEKGYQVEEQGADVFVIEDDLGLKDGLGQGNELTLTIVAATTDEEIRFAVDLCRKDQIEPGKLCEFIAKLLDLNTEINPIAFALDTLTEGDERFVLVSSLAATDLDGSEVLQTLVKFESAALVAYDVLKDYVAAS